MKNTKKRLKGPVKSCEVSISTSSNYIVFQQDSSRLGSAFVHLNICHIEELGQSGANKLQTCLKNKGFNTTKKVRKTIIPYRYLSTKSNNFNTPSI